MRNIRVTERNASEVPIDWLYVRYHRLSRWISESSNPKSEWQDELILITSELDTRSKVEWAESPYAEQLELEVIPINTRETYVPIVEERLREYYRLTQEYAWHKRMLEEMLNSNVMGKHAVTYGQITLSEPFVGRSELKDIQKLRVVEKQEWLISLEEKILPIKTILQTRLNDEQRNLVEHKYLTRDQPKDQYLIMKFHMGRQKYYNLKNQALTKIAYELGLI